MSRTKTIADRVERTDRRLTHAAAGLRDTPAARVFGGAAEIADQPPLIILSLATAAAGLVMRRPVLIRGGLRMLAAHALATGVKSAIKHRVNRSRPAHALDEGDERFEAGESSDHDLNSFPSGHLAGAVAVSRAAGRTIPHTAWPAAIVTGAVAAAQAPAGNHYFGDMVAGAAIGWAAEAVVGAAFERAEPVIADAVERWREG